MNNSTRVFLLDENILKRVFTTLRAAKYKVTRVRDERLGSQLDTTIFAYARVRHMTIIAFDTDYLDHIKFPPPHSVIFVLRSFPKRSDSSVIVTAI